MNALLFPERTVAFSRVWALPSPWTFSIPPIADFVRRWTEGKTIVVDPFCGKTVSPATHRNDLVPGRGNTAMQADEFLCSLVNEGTAADAVLLDPPYFPRQIAEHYAEAGLKTSRSATQLSGLVARCRRAVCSLVPVGGVVLHFGWNSNGMGRNAGFDLAEVLLVRHGGGAQRHDLSRRGSDATAPRPCWRTPARWGRRLKLSVAPITVKTAKVAVRLWHRHLKQVTGALWATSVVDENDVLRGVALVGRPARTVQDGWTCEVIRCATDGTRDEHFNACSLLYSTCRRVAQTLGYRRCLTKSLPEEGGASFRALGIKPLGLTRGGEWSRPSRKRRPAVRPEPKTQWDLLGGLS